MPIFTVFLAGQATVLREQRVEADSEEDAKEKAVNYASIGNIDPDWRIDPCERVTDITAEVVNRRA